MPRCHTQPTAYLCVYATIADSVIPAILYRNTLSGMCLLNLQHVFMAYLWSIHENKICSAIHVSEESWPQKGFSLKLFINSSTNLLFACQKDIIFFNRVRVILGNNNHDPITVSSGSSVDKSIENTGLVSFDIKFTRQGFENACWHREACRAIQQALSKPSLVNLISKDANLVLC